jgi:two-component system sensor histidine kinase BarA
MAGKSAFDIILMDVHMPCLSGLDATRQIRQGQTPNALAPIVAVTADVMPENHRKIFEAGMDEVLIKPVNEEQLLATIARFLGRSESIAQPTSVDAVREQEEPLPVLDRVSALKVANGNQQIADELLQLMLKEGELEIEMIGQLLAEQSLEVLAEKAHRLRGSAAVCGAKALHAVLGEIEKTARHGDTQSLSVLYQRLRQEFSSLRQEELS